jgi:hypothetical protein
MLRKAMMPDGIGVGFAESGDLVVSCESASKTVAHAVSLAPRLRGDEACELRIVEHWHKVPTAPAP